MYKAIVVGTDGSKRAAIAVSEALALAKSGGATLHVVHAMPRVKASDYLDPALVAPTRDEMRAEGTRICAQVAADAEQEGVSAEIHSVDGDPADVLLKVSEEVAADLLVIGNQGMSGIKRFVLGSVPNKVSHRCPCSLLIVNTERV